MCMYSNSRCNDVVEELSLHFLLYRTICIALQFLHQDLHHLWVCKYKNYESKYIHTTFSYFYFAQNHYRNVFCSKLCPKKYCDNPIVHHKTYGKNSDLVYWLSSSSFFLAVTSGYIQGWLSLNHNPLKALGGTKGGSKGVTYIAKRKLFFLSNDANMASFIHRNEGRENALKMSLLGMSFFWNNKIKEIYFIFF